MSVNEWKVIGPKFLSAGNVTISVRNKGLVEHELVLLRTDLKPSTIRIDKKTDRFNEAAPEFNSAGDRGGESGQNENGIVQLDPGPLHLCLQSDGPFSSRDVQRNHGQVADF